MKRACIILCILAVILSQNTSYAQRAIQKKVTSPTFSSFVEYRAWERDMDGANETVSQFSSPVYLNLPLTSSLAFNLIGSAALSSAEDNNLSGLCDVKANAVALLVDDSIMLTAGIGLPSGKSKLDTEEILVSRSLSDRAMGFRYNRLGEGLDINVACGVARAFGPVALGAGAGYVVKGKYEYLEDEDSEYKPGNQINVTGGFDLLLGILLLRSDLTYSIYQSDEVDESEVFKEGARLTIEETAVIPMGRLTFLLSGAYVNRGENEFLYEAFEGQTEKIYGDQIDVNGIINLRVMEPLDLKLLAESTFISENEDGQDDAVVFGFGAGLAFRFMGMSSLDLIGKYYTGNSNDGDVSLTGFSTIAALRIVF